MLCDSCAAHFEFSRPDIIKACQSNKQTALDFGTQTGFQDSHIAILENDLVRYQRLLGVRTQTEAQDQGAAPRPWARPHSFDRLFGTCESVRVWQTDHGRSWKDLCQSAARGDCQLCETLVAMMQYATQGVVMDDESLQVTSDWLVKRGSCFPSGLRFQIIGNGELRELCFFQVSVNEENKAVYPTLRPPRIPYGMSTAAQTCVDFLYQTLSNCLANHPSCTPRQVDCWIPKRLLNVSPVPHQPSSIILVETAHLEMSEAQHKVQYCTLSHVWGKCKPAMLTQDTYAEFTSGFEIESLPRCFQDAIHITRSLGVQYLWIDTLCIMQDSSIDWKEQVALMDKIYRGGVCNLAACDVSSSYDSLFSKRCPKTGSAIIHRQSYADSSTVFAIVPDWPQLTWRASKLYRRAWAIQERFLSPRIIHFSQFPIWECNSSLITEGFPPSDSIECFDEFPGFPESQRGWLFPSEIKIGLIERWWNIVHQYTKCSLTYRSDVLLAMSGMARSMSKLINEPYYGGIWGGKYLILSLLWNRMSTTIAQPSQDYLAPSWSWASLDGKIYTYEYRSILQPLVEVISIHVTPKTDDIFGQLVGGELVLRGHLFEIPNPGDCREAWKGCWIDHREKEDFDTAIYFIPFAEVKDNIPSQSRRFVGLFIQPVDVVIGKRTFQRFGCREFWRDYGPQFLDEAQWERLEGLSPLAEKGEIVSII